MRRIGILDQEASARQFVDQLKTESIDAVVRHDPDDASWEIWIRDEADLPAAREAFSEFRFDPAVSPKTPSPDDLRRSRMQAAANPTRPGTTHSEDADTGVADTEFSDTKVSDTEAFESESDDPTSVIDQHARQDSFPVTLALIALSVLISFTANFGQPNGAADPGETTLEERTYSTLSFVDRGLYAETDRDPLASIRRGEVWRVVTPMFLHGDMFHLAFNMMWIFYLGSAIERLHGSLFFGLLTLACELGGTFLQVYLPDADWLPATLHGTPFSIGASGAVYGMLGYLWIRPIVDADYPIDMDQTTIVLMLGWLVACIGGLIPNVANGAHLGGLIAGMVVAAGFYRRRR